MTNRERFKAVMNYEKPDRLPYFEEGIRKSVLKSWYMQGLSKDADLSRLFYSDYFEELAPDLDPMPAVKRWPVSNNDFNHFSQRLDPFDKRRVSKNFFKQAFAAIDQDIVIFLRVHRGLFISLGIEGWQRFEEVMSLMTANPALIRKHMNIQGEFAARFADRLLSEIKVDAAIFSEPVSSNEGPLVSPEMYEEFALTSYQPLMAVLKNHGIETIIFRTYANSRILLPLVLKYGFNCLWACETNSEAMDYRSIRNEFGKDFRLIGGIDLDVLRMGKDAIHRELKTKLPMLINEGGYIPMADGRVREDIPYENYLYYRKLLSKIILG